MNAEGAFWPLSMVLAKLENICKGLENRLLVWVLSHLVSLIFHEAEN